ncbi:uncharacterized protein LOC110917461 [Helianthus annuus]|uniref:uncharacterized protein LOC110917461 n=1 Tax=Helianthus annuus TaxID=4232 RepID=UPI000B8FC92F|nr:uncharacterized protein LOC110917461 [Helianthus annuus]
MESTVGDKGCNEVQRNETIDVEFEKTIENDDRMRRDLIVEFENIVSDGRELHAGVDGDITLLASHDLGCTMEETKKTVECDQAVITELHDIEFGKGEEDGNDANVHDDIASMTKTKIDIGMCDTMRKKV